MVTATDDQSDRLSALETGVAELRVKSRENAVQTNDRLSALETGVSELRAELRTDIRAMNDRLDRHQGEISARIERLYWAIVGVGVAVIVVGGGIIGALIALVLRS